MPEAFAVVLVVLVAAGVYVGARLHARNPANHHPGRELERLRGQVVWLRQRMQRARHERWSGDMVARLSEELSEASRELEKANASVGGR